MKTRQSLIWLAHMNIKYSCSLNREKLELKLQKFTKKKNLKDKICSEINQNSKLSSDIYHSNQDISDAKLESKNNFFKEYSDVLLERKKNQENREINLELNFQTNNKTKMNNINKSLNYTKKETDDMGGADKHLISKDSSISSDFIKYDHIKNMEKPNQYANLNYGYKMEKKSEEDENTRSLIKNIDNISELKNFVLNFDKCKLKHFANNTVFSDGIIGSKILLIGEAPGAKEDELGIPFCGESGELLDNMLASIDLSRKTNVYITNTIFWRPPANRRPTDEEIEICRPLVEKHIALVQPKLIILVGGTAANSVLKTTDNVTQMRGRFYEYSNMYIKKPIHTTVIFHPAYLLRQPNKKKDTWYDLIRIQQFIKDNIET